MRIHSTTLLQTAINTYISASVLDLAPPIMVRIYRVEVCLTQAAVITGEWQITELLSCYDQPTGALAMLDDKRVVCDISSTTFGGLAGVEDFTSLPGGGLLVPGKLWMAFSTLNATTVKRTNVRFFYDEVETSMLAYAQEMAARV